MQPYSTTITDTQIVFSRGIKIGDSKESVAAAYHGYNGNPWEYEGTESLFYDYRPKEIVKRTDDAQFDLDSQTGGVSYAFENNRLTAISIEWYNGYLAFD